MQSQLSSVLTQTSDAITNVSNQLKVLALTAGTTVLVWNLFVRYACHIWSHILHFPEYLTVLNRRMDINQIVYQRVSSEQETLYVINPPGNDYRRQSFQNVPYRNQSYKHQPYKHQPYKPRYNPYKSKSQFMAKVIGPSYSASLPNNHIHSPFSSINNASHLLKPSSSFSDNITFDDKRLTIKKDLLIKIIKNSSRIIWDKFKTLCSMHEVQPHVVDRNNIKICLFYNTYAQCINGKNCKFSHHCANCIRSSSSVVLLCKY